MFGLPQWAIGVGVIIFSIPAAIVLLRVLMRLLHLEATYPELKACVVDPTERAEALEDVHVRLGELDQLRQRISELEERVDFAERLLAKQREGQRLGPSQD